MALSQVQCLDDNHVNPRTHESKVEFLYCEDQRLALEALLRDGHEALVKLQKERGLRGFLSEPEVEALSAAVEPYDPDQELYPGDTEDEEPPLSLQYWPDLSDTSVPDLDLGWPDCASYRGVTRATVYAQPPLEGQTHIKEVVRKMIAQAQKVIAVVMDVFTDVDIFRDLLDAGFKRKVSVYILLERTRLPHFLSMCQRANMHAGHLKHLRVRCSQGSEFCTRSCFRVRGQLGHRFMFIDGDKAASGSYSFTWMSSRLDRNLITVVTGQAVDAFDQLFRFLYVTSGSVDLRKVATEPEPEPEPVRQPAPVAPPSAADLRKLYNPKYALLMAGNHTKTPSPGSKEPPTLDTSKTPGVPGSKNRKQVKGSKDSPQEAPPLHPGLSNLEKACLISYLPTWPEPDPPSDVIGFINIRDASKPTQVHLQRSERFETSQAIRFSSPFSMPEEILPEVAHPRQFTVNREEKTQHQTTQGKESAVKANQATQLSPRTEGEAPGEKSSTSGPTPEPVTGTNQALNTESELRSNTPANQDAGHISTAHLSAHTHSPSSSNTSTPNAGRCSNGARTLMTSSPEPQSLPGANAENQAETSFDTQSAAVHGTHTQESRDSEQHTQAKTDVQTSTVHSHSSPASPPHPPPVTSTSLSEQNHTPSTTVQSGTATSVCTTVPSTDCSSSAPPPVSSSTALHPPLPPSSAPPLSTPIAPVPKPRTVHLVIKNRCTDEKKLPEISVGGRPEIPAGKSELESVPQPQTNGGSRTGKKDESENAGNLEEAPQQKQNVTSQKTKDDKTVGAHSSAEAKPQALSDGWNIQEITPEEVEPGSLTPSESEVPPKEGSESVASEQAVTKAPGKTSEFPDVLNEKGEAATQCRKFRARAHEPQRILYCELQSPDSATANAHVPKDTSQQSVRSSENTHVKPKHITHSNSITAQESPHTPKARGGSHTLSNTHVTAERDLQPILSPVRTPTPDGILPRTPTPDSRAYTPDSRAYTPDFRTPTPDGFRDYSNLSATSDEYFECSTSPFHDPVFEQTGPVHVNHTTWAENESDNEETEKRMKLSAAERQAKPDGEWTEARGHDEATARKDLHQESIEVRPDEGRVGDEAAPGPSVVERRDRPWSPRETERQKPPRRQQQDRPPPPAMVAVGSATGRKQVEVPRSQSQSIFPRPPPVTGSRTRSGQYQNAESRPRAQASVFYTQSNAQSKPRPHFQNQEESVRGTHRQEGAKSPFSLTFGKLYNLKGLKDKMSKLPSPSRAGSTSRKSNY